jgi:hypothetical protein
MWVEPATGVDGATVGYMNTFNVTVYLNVTSMTNSWQTYLTYNKFHLLPVNHGYTGAGKSLWSAALPTDNPVVGSGPHDANLDYLLYGEVLKASAEKTGLGSLFWVEFQVIKAPGKYETLDSYISVDLALVFWSSALDKDFANIVPALVFGNCHYTYVWAQPAAAHLAVSPTLKEYGPLPPPAVGLTFPVTVTLNIDVGWANHNATFDLVYNSTLLSVTAYTVAALWLNSAVVNNPGDLNVVVWNPSSTPSGPVLIITATFQVMYQALYPAPDTDTSPLALTNIVLWDTTATIPYDNPTNGVVKIHPLMTLQLSYKLVSSPTMGPGPSIGQHFNVTVSWMNLDPAWFGIGIDFRLSFDKFYIEPVAVYEGHFLPHYAALQPGSLGTWFYGQVVYGDPVFGDHVLVGDLILPNASGRWNAPFPDSKPPATAAFASIAIIEFKVMYQSFGEAASMTSPLNIIENDVIGLVDPLADPQVITYIPENPAINGTYTITTNWPGRMLDIYTQYPAPFGGQGLGMPSDMFWPQKQVELYANVTYNYWPVQQKDVAFQVMDPSGNLWATLVARSDVNGVAHTSFRIPWPCDHPETLFGVWTVYATVDIACIVVNDTLRFHFDYMVEIFKVTTDKYEYNHCDLVSVTIEYGSHAQQTYPALFVVVIKDELNVPIGYIYVSTIVGGTVFCQYKNGTTTVSIHIPKFAFAGIASVYVTAYNMWPSWGGSAWCPTYGDGWPIGPARLRKQ